jgi:hypothetical protein
MYAVFRAGGEVERVLPDERTLFASPRAATWESTMELADALLADPRFAYATPDLLGDLFEPRATTNDPFIDEAWHLDRIDAFDAWDITMGDPSIVVGIIDRGFAPQEDIPPSYHELQGVLPVPKFQTDSCYHWMHGTAVTGLIVAEANNGIGGAGVCPDCSYVQFPTPGSLGALAELCSIVQNSDIRIFNCSWGYDGWVSADAYPLFDGCIGNPVSRSMVFAAGNIDIDACDLGGTGGLCLLNGAMCVAASDKEDELVDEAGWWASAYGPCTDIAAPGLDLITPFPDENPDKCYYWSCEKTSSGATYCPFNGTSGAAPLVSGTVGLMLSVNPSLGPFQIKELIRCSGDPLHGTEDLGGPFRRLNAYRAVQAACQAGLGQGPCEGWEDATTPDFCAEFLAPNLTDSDGDGILDDGDGSGTVGDARCTSGETEECDDNCIFTPNPGQEDRNGDGIGDACTNPGVEPTPDVVTRSGADAGAAVPSTGQDAELPDGGQGDSAPAGSGASDGGCASGSGLPLPASAGALLLCWAALVARRRVLMKRAA